MHSDCPTHIAGAARLRIVADTFVEADRFGGARACAHLDPTELQLDNQKIGGKDQHLASSMLRPIRLLPLSYRSNLALRRLGEPRTRSGNLRAKEGQEPRHIQE